MPRRCRCQDRNGTAVVELAICLPVIFLLVFGSIQACNLIFLKQATTEAAYEGMLVAIMPGVTQADVENRIDTVLQARNITGGAVSYNGATFGSLVHGDPLTLVLTVPAAANMVGPTMFTISPNVTVRLRGDKQ